METGHDMELPDPGTGVPCLVHDVLYRHFVRTCFSLAPAERAELAPVHAEIRGIDVHVLNKVDPVSVLSRSGRGGHAAKGKEIVRGEQGNAVVPRKTLAREYFFLDLILIHD